MRYTAIVACVAVLLVYDGMFAALVAVRVPLARTLSTAASRTRQQISVYEDPAWSPSGRFLAFAREIDDQADLFLVDLAGHPPSTRRVTREVSIDANPAFCGDDDTIVFDSNRSGTRDLWVLSLASGHAQRLSNADHEEYRPACSSDGSRIAYTVRIDEIRSLRLLDRNTANTRQLTGADSADEWPAWGPGDRSLVFHTSSQPDWWEIAVLDLGSGLTITVTDHGRGGIGVPRFMPGGDTILFHKRVGTNWEIFRQALDGSSLQRLTVSVANETFPAPSPDGQRIAFRSDRSGVMSIYTMAMDGTDVRLVSR